MIIKFGSVVYCFWPKGVAKIAEAVRTPSTERVWEPLTYFIYSRVQRFGS